MNTQVEKLGDSSFIEEELRITDGNVGFVNQADLKSISVRRLIIETKEEVELRGVHCEILISQADLWLDTLLCTNLVILHPGKLTPWRDLTVQGRVVITGELQWASLKRPTFNPWSYHIVKIQCLYPGVPPPGWLKQMIDRGPPQAWALRMMADARKELQQEEGG